MADISPDNPTSQRVAARNGFHPDLDAEPERRDGKVYVTIPWTRRISGAPAVSRSVESHDGGDAKASN